MHLADTLSRAPLPITTSHDEVLTIDNEIEMTQMVDFLPLHKVSLEEICKESLQDSTIQTLQKVIQSGWSETKNNLPHNVMAYFNVCDKLSAQERRRMCSYQIPQTRSPIQNPQITHWHGRMLEMCKIKCFLFRNECSCEERCQPV